MSQPGYAERFETAVGRAYTDLADPDAAPAMVAYMRGQFPFLGIRTPARVAALRSAAAPLGRPTEAELADFARRCWRHPEREWQYAGLWLLRRFTKRVAGPDFLDVLEPLITSLSWWDTVDELSHVAGLVVARHPDRVAVMDRWIGAEDFWLARVALLHQLTYGAATDAERLYRYCDLRSPDPEFFVRKAIGWALRQHSRTDPAGVVDYVRSHTIQAPADGPVISGLSAREALKWLANRGDPAATDLLSDVRARPRQTRPPAHRHR